MKIKIPKKLIKRKLKCYKCRKKFISWEYKFSAHFLAYGKPLCQKCNNDFMVDIMKKYHQKNIKEKEQLLQKNKSKRITIVP